MSTKRAAKKAPKSRDKLSDAAMPITSPRIDTNPPPAQAQPVVGGPTTGYRDGIDAEGVECVETKTFWDGVIPEGWVDTPANLKNDYRKYMVTIL